MNEAVRNRGQFRKIAPDELSLRIEAFRLGDRVEYPEIGLRIATARRSPLPAPVVGGQVEVVQLTGKKSLAATPVDAQILDQESYNFV